MTRPSFHTVNFISFLWHGTFLALASSFVDVDTVMPVMITQVGGEALHVGILVAIMLGGSSVAQMFFVPLLHRVREKKRYLLLGINLRILALAALGGLFFGAPSFSPGVIVWIVLLLVAVFSLSGSFANVSYVDILGRVILPGKRKSFFTLRQGLSSFGILISAVTASGILVRYSNEDGYAYLFLLAALFLAVASLGFWQIREDDGKKEHGDPRPSANGEGLALLVRREVLGSCKLKNYLLTVATLGNALSLMAFLVIYAKGTLPAGEFSVGAVLLVKLLGAVLAGFGLYFLSSRLRYSSTLYLTAILGVFIPLLTLFLAGGIDVFLPLFFAGGVMLSAYRVSMSGILLEISNESNRTIFTGAVGVGNIVPALFSLVGGWTVGRYGFGAFFCLFTALMLLSLFFIYKLDCRK